MDQTLKDDDQIDDGNALNEKNCTAFGQAAERVKSADDDQQFCLGQYKKHHFSFAFFQYSIGRLYQQYKTGDTDGGTRQRNYTINDAFCKKKIVIKETVSTPIAFLTGWARISGLFFIFMSAGDGE